MRRTSLVLVCAGFALAVVPSLRAQAPADSSPVGFHPGQWGVGFVGTTNIGEAGVLRFSTPTRAWVLDGSAAIDRQHVSDPNQMAERNAEAFALLLGPRWYHAESARLVRFSGFGVSGGYQRLSGGNLDGLDMWSVGAYGELGMQYLFSPHFGLGWRGNLSLMRVESSTRLSNNPTALTQTDYRVTLTPVQVVGTIFF